MLHFAILTVLLAATTALPASAQQVDIVRQYDLAGCNITGNFDEHGAIRVQYADPLGLQYNPVTVAQYALGCYHSYKRTGKQEYRTIFLNQIKWLQTHYVPVGSDMAAYEYGFPWSYGLQPGWRSGLAQGQAISALIRYVIETGDRSVLPLIQRLKKYMLLPTEKGGLVARTPEGGMWIEEFPSSPPSLVWNGYVSAIFGLYEYAQLFPQDRVAAEQLDEAIRSLKASLPAYDVGNWTFLDRRSKPYPRATNGYQSAHAAQMRTMAQVTKDPYFANVWLRWQSFYTDANFDAQGTMTADQDGTLRLQPRLPALLGDNRLKDNIATFNGTKSIDGYGSDKLFDGRDDSYFAPASNGETVINLTVKKPVRANSLTLGLYNAELFPRSLTIAVKECGGQKLEPLEYRFASSRTAFTYYFKPREICEVEIRSSKNAGQDRLVIAELAMTDLGDQATLLPEVGTHSTPVLKMTEPTFSVRLTPSSGVPTATALYRCADSADAVASRPWVFDMLNPVRGDSRVAPAPFCQFKFISDPTSAAAGWRVSVEGAASP